VSTETPSPGTPPPAVPSQDDLLDRGPYQDGFSSRTVVGALFVALVMMPGSIYMSLVAGQSLGAAAEWVTIILFAEMARRSFANLKRQEVFVLFYVASGIAAASGGPFFSAIWNQYLLQAPETSTLADRIPDWVVPPVTSAAIQGRNLLHADWWWSASRGFLAPATLIAIGWVLGRMAFFGLGYIVFRLTSDVERLPFPLAPIAAEGATALAESTERDTDGGGRRRRSWRWNVFSIGACFGIVFACLYVLLPVASGLFLSKPIMLFPIPFVDFTANVERFLPASLVSLSFDAGLFLAGMVLPFRLVTGTFTSTVLTGVLAGPLLLRLGAFPHWTPGNGLLVNQMVLSFDFYMSVGVGLAATVAGIGLWTMGKAFVGYARRKGMASAGAPTMTAPLAPGEPPYRTACKERGDIPLWVAVVLFIASVAGFSALCKTLVPDFHLWIVLVFGFIWSPLHSYISARLIGVTGGGLSTPYLKETVFILSGYKGVDIWFAPIPLMDQGGAAARFRELELTRTRFTSLIKAELLMFPIIFACSFIFWGFFWHMNQLPSGTFPFAARQWPVAARQAYLIFTANSSESPLLLQALNPKTIIGAGLVGLVLYNALGRMGVPAVFFYGLIGGVGAPLHGGLSLMVGAVVGRCYFRRRIGEERWTRYVPVVAAGFACGAGLAGMLAVSLSLIMQCAKDLPF